MKEITDYITYVQKNASKHSLKTKQSIERIAAIVKRVESGEIIYNESEVDKIFKFFAKLIPDQSGKPIVLMPWQKFFIASIFGFRNKKGQIVLNDVFLFIAKKNGKTAIIAGIALYYLITTKDAKVLLTASDYGQAKIAFEMISEYISNTPTLRAALDDFAIQIKESPPLTITYYPGNAKIAIIPETRAKQANGFNPNFVMFDEIASYRTSKIMTALSSGQVKKNAIRASLTTAETNMQNPGRFEYDRAADVLSGKYSSTNYFPLVYELDAQDDKWDEANYCKANPSLDIIKPLRKIIEDRERAKQVPTEESSFFAYQLNVWSQNAGTDISDEDWQPAIDNAAKYAEYITHEKLATYPCFGAVDLSKIDDYTAYTKFFWIKALSKFYAMHRFYIPAAMLEKKLQVETEQLAVWVKRDIVTATQDGQGDRVINLEYLERDIIEDAEKYKMIGLTYDVAHALKFIESLDAKTPTLPKIPFSQGWKKISPANKKWLEIVYKKQLIDDNPVMRWMAGCVRIRNDRIGNTYFDKINYRQSPLRIDGVDTSVMALSQLVEQIEQGMVDLPEQVKKAIDIGTEYGY